MPLTDQEIKLVLNLGASGADAAKVRAELAKLQAATGEAAKGYGVLERKAGAYAVATASVDKALDQFVHEAVAATSASRAMAEVLGDTAPAAAKLAGKKTNAGQGLLGASYAAQDFVSVLTNGGGIGKAIGSITNNVPQVLSGLGMSAGLAGAFSLVAVGVAALIEKWPEIEKLWSTSAGKTLPALNEQLAQLDRVDALTSADPELTRLEQQRDEALEKAKELRKTIKEGGQSGYFNVQQDIDAYNQATSAAKGLEVDIRRHRAAHSVEKMGPERRERVSAFKGALGTAGGSEWALGVLENTHGMSAEEAIDLVNAALGGEKRAIDRLARLLPKFGDVWATASPEAKAAAKAAKKQQEEERRSADKTQREADQAAERHRKHVASVEEDVRKDLDKQAQDAANQKKKDYDAFVKQGGIKEPGSIDRELHERDAVQMMQQMATGTMSRAGEAAYRKRLQGYTDKYGPDFFQRAIQDVLAGQAQLMAQMMAFLQRSRQMQQQMGRAAANLEGNPMGFRGLK